MKLDTTPRIRPLALAAICVALFMLLGIVVPYHTYSHFLVKQDTAAAAIPHEEL